MLRRLKLAAVCMLLTAAALSLDPPMIVGDTKIDLAVNPFGFLERALHLWDPAYFGQVQNQAYGYFFPNGPFHAALIALDMPPWLVQRAWMAVLLCAAFLGTVKLAEALGIGTLHTRIVAGAAYALAPRVLTLISYNSAELQPMMLLPWILLPLVLGARRGRSPLRMAMLSGVAFLCCGGTNAASELAVLVVPLIYLLTRSRGPRTRRLLLWWLTALFLVSFWWLAPLLLMGRYVYSFMPFTEDAATTTGVASLANALRGASNWMGYLPAQGQAALPSGAELSTEPWLIAVTALVAGMGMAALIDRRTPERLFLTVCLLTGTAIITAGYTGADAAAGPFAPAMREMFDGLLSPFRNIHKFDALIRLPVVLGLAHLPVVLALRAADRRAAGPQPPPPARWPVPQPQTVHRVAAATGALAFLATLTPLATVGIATPGGFERIPGYWYEAADWLDARARDGMTMAVPGSARGEYEWGRPMDEPMQPLLDAAWTNQQIIPWGSAGASRLTQEVDQRISSGRGSEGLTATLARMGVTHLLVRNDLQRSGNNGGWPARVHQALADSPGVTLRASFGPHVGSLDVQRAADWYDQPYRALEVYEVEGAAPTVGTVPAEGALRVTGGPEALLGLAEQGMLDDDRPVVIGDDPGADDIAPENTVTTDTSRRREIVYPDVRRNVSNTFTADEEPERGAPAPDIMDPAWADYTSVAVDEGIASVTASSSEAGANAAAGTRDPGRMPFAALDATADTSWRSSGFAGAIGQWLEVEFAEPREVGDLAIAFEQIPGEPPPARISIITDDASATAAVAATGEPQEFTAPQGTTSSLRIRVDELAWEPEYRFGTRVGITGLTLPGLDPARTLDVPGVPGARTVLLTGSTGSVPGCMEGSQVWVCNPDLAVQGEDAYTFDRSFRMGAGAGAGGHVISGEAVIADPVDAENAANRATGYPQVSSSSASVQHPAAMGRNAFDDDRATVWYPDPGEDAPSLDVDLGRATEIDGLRVDFPRADSVLRPVKVIAETAGTVREGWLDGSGWVGFAPFTTDELTLTFERPEDQPLEISGIRLPGVDPLEPVEGGDATTACGLGPVLRVNGERVETRIVSGTLEDVLAGRALRYESCGDTGIVDGGNRVAVEPGNRYQVRSALVAEAGAAARDEVETAPVAAMSAWGDGERRFDVAVEEDSYLVVNENFNDGWRAEAEGVDAPLEPVRLDGWKQAWRLPAGTAGTVTLTYTPDGPYHLALGVGAALALVAVAAAVRRPRGGGTPRRRLRRRLPARAPMLLTDRSGRPAGAGRNATANGDRSASGSPTPPDSGGAGAVWSPSVGPAGIRRRLLVPLALVYGVWVAGAVGAAAAVAALLVAWWLGRAPSERLRHAKPQRPASGGRLLRLLTGPFIVVASLCCAGISLAVGTYLTLYLPFHDISELLGDPLRGAVAQLCCLPALVRLAIALGEPAAPAEPAEGPDAPPPGEARGPRDEDRPATDDRHGSAQEVNA
ncbi:alpha-(1-_3)-arabinofuranosyltransferase [Nocardiopsis sediminis]|uniref:Alpha-(1->3)-arabinofuranosyltransferase n=1 Tax=Nocardiopsis sediminis TaxID=1778267 RepID=A0ABV8FJ81_9ACTN